MMNSSLQQTICIKAQGMVFSDSGTLGRSPGWSPIITAIPLLTSQLGLSKVWSLQEPLLPLEASCLSPTQGRWKCWQGPALLSFSLPGVGRAVGGSPLSTGPGVAAPAVHQISLPQIRRGRMIHVLLSVM